MGEARTPGGGVRHRVAGPRDRDADGGRHRVLPRYAHSVAPAVVHGAVPGRAQRAPRRHAARARIPRHLRGQCTRVPHGVPSHRTHARGAVRRSPGIARLARAQRVRHARLRPPRGGGLPTMAARAVRRTRSAQRRVDDGLLVAALRRVGRDPASRLDPVRAQSRPADRFPALLVGRDAHGVRRAGPRDPAGGIPGAGDDELHAAHVEPPRAVVLGRAPGRRLGRSLPRLERTGRRGACRLRVGPDPRMGGRTVAAHGAEPHGRDHPGPHLYEADQPHDPQLARIHRARVSELVVLPMARVGRRI